MSNQVAGSGIFGGGGASSGSSSGGSESPNTARSRSFLNVVYLLSQGQIKGFPDGVDIRKFIYFNETPLMNPSGSLNFKNVGVDFRSGLPTQSPLALASKGIANPQTVNTKITTQTPITRSISDPSATAIRISIYTPGFRRSDSGNNLFGTRVQFKIFIATNGGAFVPAIFDAFEFKTAGGFVRDYTIKVTPGDSWQVRIERDTPDATTISVQDEIYWQSYTTITERQFRFPNWALLSLRFDAAYFSAPPKVSIRLLGKVVRVPSNYDTNLRRYYGFWDGTFKLDWTNNPAWILLDLLTNRRYGMGHDLTDANIDIAALYQISRRNDEMLDDGRGGLEPRYVFNQYIFEALDSIEAIDSILATMHCIRCQVGGLMSFIQDAPGNPVADIFNSANVIEGYDEGGKMTQPPFNYSRTGSSARHTTAIVRWTNNQEYGRKSFAYVDLASIGYGQEMDRGIRQIDISPAGVTSEAQALRYGRWVLATERLEQETVLFAAGSQGLLRQPGEIVQIFDSIKNKLGANGRIVDADTNRVKLDAPVFIGNATVDIQFLIAGEVVTRRILNLGTTDKLDLFPNFTTIPTRNTVWQIPINSPRLYRLISVEDTEQGNYGMVGLSYNPIKHAIADTLAELGTLDLTDRSPPQPPSNLSVSQTPRGFFVGWKSSITPSVVGYILQRQEVGSNGWIDVPLSTGVTDVDLPIPSNGGYLFRVAAVNLYGKYSDWLQSASALFTQNLNPTTTTGGPPIVYATSGYVASLNPDASITLNTEIDVRDGATRYININNGEDRRQITGVYPAGIGKVIYVTPPYIGNSHAYTYNEVEGIGNRRNFAQANRAFVDLYNGSFGLNNNNVRYMYVAAGELYAAYLGDSYIIFPPGYYRRGLGEFRQIEGNNFLGFSLSVGGIVLLGDRELNYPPPNANWRVET